VAGCATHGGPKVRIIKSSSACRRSIRLSVLVARLNAASPVKSGYPTHPKRYFHRVDQDSVAHLQFVRRLIVLLPTLPRTIVAIPKLVNLMDCQGIEIAEELTAFEID
jgi:hypothetical protein